MSRKPYPSNKESGIEWLGHAPAHWRLVRLRFVARLNPSRTELAGLDRDLEVSFLPMEAIGEDGTLSLERTRPIGEVETGYSFMREGDVILAKITPCFENGKGAIASGLHHGVAFGTTELIVARPRVDVCLDRFLHWLFVSPAFRKLGEASMYGAGGQKRVPDDFVRDFRIAFPTLPEQRTIAAFLDRETAKIDALVAQQERLIALLAEKRRAVISHAVTKGLDPNAPMKDSGIAWLGEVPAHWQVAKLGRYLEILSGFAFPSAGFSIDDANTRLLRGINVGIQEVRWTETVYWQRQPGDGLERFELHAGDIVFGMDRPWIGGGTRVATLGAEDLPCLLLQRVAALRPLSSLDRGFVYLIVQLWEFQEYFVPDMTGISVPHISPEQINGFPLAIPPLEEQREIVAHLHRETAKLDTLTTEAERAITLLKERRAALISAAVTGKIDVREAVETEEVAA